MQLRLPWTSGLAASPSDTRIEPAPAAPTIFVRHRRARRYILRVLADGTLRVTLPRWGVKREALAFVAANGEWIARQRARRRAVPIRPVWADGTRVLLDGRPAVVRVERRGETAGVWLDEQQLATDWPLSAGLRPLVERWLRSKAGAELPAALRALARHHDIEVSRVSVRNQRSRWGACSATGTITLNWRLIQVPPFVRDYVLIHEVMHRRELNHSRRFWRLVVAACPRHAEARHWLKTEGQLLWSDPE